VVELLEAVSSTSRAVDLHGSIKWPEESYQAIYQGQMWHLVLFGLPNISHLRSRELVSKQK